MFSLSFGQTERPRGFLQWTVDREMGLKALIQTDPLSLLGCSKQQQGWTWSDGAVPAKHFGTCRDMKGSNETHFTIHWPHALSRQRFLPYIPAIYPVAQVCSKVPYQPTKPSLTIPSLLSLPAESAKSEAWPHNFKGTGGISNCGSLGGSTGTSQRPAMHANLSTDGESGLLHSKVIVLSNCQRLLLCTCLERSN